MFDNPSRRLRPRLAASLLGCALGLTSGRGLAAPSNDQAHRSPPVGDFTAVWMEERIKADGLAAAMRDDDRFASGLLAEPSSVYSAAADPRQWKLGGMPWQRALRRMAEELDTPMTDLDAIRTVAWDLGFTHALPGLSAGDQPVSLAGDALVQANLIKAGVSVDIFLQSLRLFGEGHYAVAAYYAVAAQLARDRVHVLPEARRRVSGIREMVVFRFMMADRIAEIVGSDWSYLANIVESERSGWHAGRTTIYGHREIPLPFRIARVAAAYRQSLPYVGDPPCTAKGLANRKVAALSPYDPRRELCASHASDRALHAWFRRVLDLQMTQDESHHGLWPVELGPALASLAHARSVRETTPHGERIARHAGHTETADRLLIEDHMRGGFSDEEAAEVLDSHLAAHLCFGSRR
ncbi:MAG TPA: hypothetical protein VM621_06665 [Luteibacter sp.]|uniref:hypothetical protein n=1 Tax=Luteibacter sp. TaxID=1886636 RepID=UPI002BEC9198|nr:hypothetical protein [Luteibacter sp.]HVI54718.1 hypothetical protein [Luteibacter sp.]